MKEFTTLLCPFVLSNQYGTLDSELVLKSSGAVTSTSSATGVALASVKEAGDFKVVIAVSAIDRANADETYVFSVETDSLAAFSDAPVTQATLVTVSETGSYEINLSGAQVAQHDADAAAIRVTATLGGTTPSITYSAHVIPTHQ